MNANTSVDDSGDVDGRTNWYKDETLDSYIALS